MHAPSNATVQSKPQILIVDDEADIRQVVTLAFQESGFRVSSAENAETACRLLKKEQYDAVVTDVMMPGEDGIKFLSKIHQEYPETPVILMTGHAQLQMAVDAIKNGAFDFIQKPFDLDQMKDVVNKAVNISRLHRAEKKQRAELEKALAIRTAELETAKVELDFAHSKILKAVAGNSQPKDSSPREDNASDTVFKIFSRLV